MVRKAAGGVTGADGARRVTPPLSQTETGKTGEGQQRHGRRQIDIAEFAYADFADDFWPMMGSARFRLSSTDPVPKKSSERLGATPDLERRAAPPIFQSIDDDDQNGDLEQSRHPSADEKLHERPDEADDGDERRNKPGYDVHLSALGPWCSGVAKS